MYVKLQIKDFKCFQNYNLKIFGLFIKILNRWDAVGMEDRVTGDKTGFKSSNAGLQVNTAAPESMTLGSSPISTMYLRCDFSPLLDFAVSQFC